MSFGQFLLHCFLGFPAQAAADRSFPDHTLSAQCFISFTLCLRPPTTSLHAVASYFPPPLFSLSHPVSICAL